MHGTFFVSQSTLNNSYVNSERYSNNEHMILHITGTVNVRTGSGSIGAIACKAIYIELTQCSSPDVQWLTHNDHLHYFSV